MAILLECYNVIAPASAVAARYPGGEARYRADCPNGTYTQDEHLTRVGFMGLEDVGRFVTRVTAAGLAAADVAVVDSVDGPLAACDWLDWSRDGGPSRCWLRGTPEGELCRMAPPDLDALLASLASEAGAPEAEPGAAVDPPKAAGH